MKIQSINNLVVAGYIQRQEQKSFRGDSLAAVNFKHDGGEAIKSYAITSPNFKSVTASSTNFDLILTDEEREPRIKLQISANKDIPVKQGLYPIYSMSLNDQMVEELNKNPDLCKKDAYIRPEGRKLDIRCSQEDLIPTLRMIKDRFIDVNINDEHLNEVKQLAPVAFVLDRKAKHNSPEYSDIPAEASEEQYIELVDNISKEDLKDYNHDILKNSDKEVQLFVNKEFYLANKDEIEQILSNWFEKSNV